MSAKTVIRNNSPYTSACNFTNFIQGIYEGIRNAYSIQSTAHAHIQGGFLATHPNVTLSLSLSKCLFHCS